jgi:O-antigen ligase
MGALTLLVLADLLTAPFDVQLWSVAAAKYVVPYTMFYLAGLVFDSEAALRSLEWFAVVVFAYLAITSIAYITGLTALVFPQFILDPALGTHVERARGPFLQAQANGTAINLLGLLTLDFYRRGRVRGIGAAVLLFAYPVAILATKTRAVWLAFGVSTALLARWTGSARIRRVCLGLLLAGALGLAALAVRSLGDEGSMRERLTNVDTVDFRFAAYQAGWTMFREHPFAGWGASRVETELADRIDGFHGDVFVVHNTYLEILLEHGLVGFALYTSIVLGLLRLSAAKKTLGDPDHRDQGLLDSLRGPLWPLLLAVYFVSASLVVMNYQFVNALVFTLAGILAADNRRQRTEAALAI